MKIKIFSLVFSGFFLFFGVNLFSQAPVDLNLDLTRFAPETIPGRWVILYGQIEGYRVLNRVSENYEVEVTLLLAKWLDNEEIRSWRGLVTFRGEGFQEVFPVRLGANRPASVLAPGTRVILVAQHIGWSFEREAPQFKGAQIRSLTF